MGKGEIMSAIATAVVVGSALTGSMSSGAQSSAADAAAGAQTDASIRGIAEQQRQFDYIQQLLKPYVESGVGAIGAQQGLLGLSGPEAQQQAITALEQSPQFYALQKQGENALLQNAAATGGLRGGNIQGALAQFRPQLLSQIIENQFGRLGQLSGLGQASAAGQAAAAQQTGNSIAGLLGQQGQAQAGAAMAAGQGQANMWGNVGSSIGTLGMMSMLNKTPVTSPSIAAR